MLYGDAKPPPMTKRSSVKSLLILITPSGLRRSADRQLPRIVECRPAANFIDQVNTALGSTDFETDEDRASFDERWDPIVGDRQTEIVFIGVDMDEAAIRARLDSCVVTGREFEKGPKKWAHFRDPLPEWDLSCDLDY